jgi:hypothetical protein
VHPPRAARIHKPVARHSPKENWMESVLGALGFAVIIAAQFFAAVAMHRRRPAGVGGTRVRGLGGTSWQVTS